MKLILILLSMFAFAFSYPASSDLTLNVTNVKSESGVVRVLLFQGEEGFPDQADKAFKSASVKIEGNTATVVFESIPEGDYAIAVFHDSQNTGKLRTNALGVPKDGYGFSNDVMGTFGPPAYKDATIKVTSGKNNTSIKLR